MDDERDAISAWIAREIIPHEASIRSWLARRWSRVLNVEDVIQEAYCRVAGLESVAHIENPAGYFHRTAQSIATDMIRRAGIVTFTSLTQIEWSTVIDTDPPADRAIAASQELQRVNRLLSQLSDTHRRAIELRRIEGLSRKETAARLGVSEDALKKHIERGMHRIMTALAEQDAGIDGDGGEALEQKAQAIGKQRPH